MLRRSACGMKRSVIAADRADADTTNKHSATDVAAASVRILRVKTVMAPPAVWAFIVPGTLAIVNETRHPLFPFLFSSFPAETDDRHPGRFRASFGSGAAV